MAATRVFRCLPWLASLVLWYLHHLVRRNWFHSWHLTFTYEGLSVLGESGFLRVPFIVIDFQTEAIIQNKNSHPFENYTRFLLCITFTRWSVTFQQKCAFMKELKLAALFQKSVSWKFLFISAVEWHVKKQTLPVENPTPRKAEGPEFACLGVGTWHTCVGCAALDYWPVPCPQCGYCEWGAGHEKMISF